MEIEQLLHKNVICESRNVRDSFISTVFIRNKKDGAKRFILNLTALNDYVEKIYFKMDTLHSVINLMKRNCWFASVDLKDAYYSVPISLAYQQYLSFCWDGKTYNFTCLPNGLSSAPRIFTKLMKLVTTARTS